MSPQTQSRPRIYLSHSINDREFVEKLIRDLRLEGGIQHVWYDAQPDLNPWLKEIQKLITACDVFIVVLSPDAVASQWVIAEIKFALDQGKRLIPILYRPCEIPIYLYTLQVISFLSTNTYQDDFYKLLIALGLPTTLLPIIEISIEQGDITSFEADVVALKYAQGFYGADALIARNLGSVGITEGRLRPSIGDFRYVETQNCIKAHHALFVGVPNLTNFGYQQINEFSKLVLDILTKEAPSTNHLAMTVHGVHFGLDEIEAFLAQFIGYLEAMLQDQLPPNLRYISIVDKNLGRVQRLREALEEYVAHANYASQVETRWAYQVDIQRLKKTSTELLQPGWKISGLIKSKAKPHVFVAMPFNEDMDDTFFYGIQQPVRAAGFLCERVDQEAFIGDILDQVKKKIETAAVVIAELSGANPNVYLEVGYAWGKGRPTILLVKNEQELRFDVRGQRCLKYTRIMDLEKSLSEELNTLKFRRMI